MSLKKRKKNVGLLCFCLLNIYQIMAQSCYNITNPLVMAATANGMNAICMAQSCYNITNPPVMTLSANATKVSCNGAPTATATATAVGNINPVSYLWSNGATTATATGLAIGTYTVTVSQNVNCKATSSVNVSELLERRYTVSHTGVSGGGSLRQCILCANARIAFDTIDFNIPPTDPSYRNPDGIANNGDEFFNLSLAVNDLPIVTDPLLIDALTQPGALCNNTLVSTFSPNAGADAVQKGLKPKGLKFVVNGGGLDKQGIEIQSSASLLILRGLVFVNWINPNTTANGTIKLVPLTVNSKIRLDCSFMTNKI